MYAAEKLRAECMGLLEAAMGKDSYSSSLPKIRLEKPPKGIGADLALPCFAISGNENPAAFASRISQEINSRIAKKSMVRKAEPSGPYVNFTAGSSYAKAAVREILSKKLKYGSRPRNGKTIIIDYSSPNIAKPMNIGHLRSTIIGQSIYNTYSFLGYKCIGDNHLGDWGTQFGKLMAAFSMWGDAERLKKEGIRYLTELYVRFHEEEKKDEKLGEDGRAWFRKLETGDAEATRLWKIFFAMSMEEFQKVYALLNVKFDMARGESSYYKEGLALVSNLRKNGMAEESDGAVIIKFRDESLPPLVIQKSDEATLYSTRDLACIKYRNRFHPHALVYVIGSEQKLYLRQLFEAARMMGFRFGMVHVDFGLYTIEGAKMSTRSGKFVLLNDLLEESITRAGRIIEEKNPSLVGRDDVARKVGVGAVIFNDLKQERIKSIDFDWEKVLNFEGDSCPYLQYAYVRTNSILEKAPSEKRSGGRRNLEWGREEMDLAKKLADFPMVIESAAQQYKPSVIAQYLLDVATLFSEFYSSSRVIGSEREQERLGLVESTGIVIRNGLWLLNIEAPEKM